MFTIPDLPWAGAREIARAVSEQRLSAIEMAEALSAHIDRVDPELHAFLLRNPRLQRQARTARGPLAGVPISIKDIILTRGMPTTAGSRTFGEGLPGTRDALVVRRLRRAGALILGKTNLHELAMGVTTVNEHFGPSRNPWDRDRVPGGSSGGSAVAVAVGMGAGSVGTDTRGSIRIPAACCGVTGLKPTYGLVPTEGVVPLAASLDHVGPLARSVEDAALLLGVMAGGSRRVARWLAAVDSPARPAARIGLCDWFLSDLDPSVEGPVRGAIGVFERAGFPIRPVEIEGLAEAHAASGVITSAEALAFHAQRLQENPEGIGPAVRERLAKGAGLTAVDLVRAYHTQAVVTAAFLQAFETVDCLAGAVLPGLPPRIGEHTVRVGERDAPTLDAFTRLTSPANMAGLPALALPCGTTPAGLPVALQLIAAPGREDVVLALGAWLQRQTDWHRRRPPLAP